MVAEGVVAPRVHQALQDPRADRIPVGRLRERAVIARSTGAGHAGRAALWTAAAGEVLRQVAADLVGVPVLVLGPQPLHHTVDVFGDHLVLAVRHELVQDYPQVLVVALQQR